MKTQSSHLLLQTLILLLIGIGGSRPAVAQTGFDHTHGSWDALLQRHVLEIADGTASQVDYAGMMTDRESLRRYLDSLATVSSEQFEGWTASDQLTFLINAYNAWTVELILGEYPQLDSIRDLGSLFRSPWSQKVVSLFGERVSLDHVEHELIRGADGFAEPRIHFAVNCASVGCPALRPSAYVGERLEQQLEEATRLFLADRTRNRLDGNTLRVSKIFDWYEADFEQGWRDSWSVAQFLARYSSALGLPDSVTQALRQDSFRIRYLDYDWSLNDLRQ